MGHYLTNLLKFPALYRQFKRNTNLQKTFLQESVLKDLEFTHMEPSDSLSPKEVKKIEYYYGNAVVSILGEGFCILRGQIMTPKERKALTYLGALTGLVDDFFDVQNSAHEHIRLLIDEPIEKHARNLREQLFVQFAAKALEHVPSVRETRQAAYGVFDAQILSKQQTNSAITENEIEQITLKKGAASIHFYRTVFGNIVNTAEQNMIEKIGHIGQLENDIFDIYKDVKNGIFTLPTTCKKIDLLRQKYRSLHKQIKDLAGQTVYEKKNTEGFLRFIAAILSRGYVCLDFLEKNETSTAGVFQLSSYTRQQLVCDMEKPINILRSLHYFAKLV